MIKKELPLKIGESVVVKKDADTIKRTTLFYSGMKEYKGKSYKIKEIDEFGDFILDIDCNLGTSYAWHKDWLYPLSKKYLKLIKGESTNDK